MQNETLSLAKLTYHIGLLVEGNFIRAKVLREIEYYNLDVIISVGYRVKSKKGVRFRQWATSVLKNYIQSGYLINSEKITHQRFKELENDVSLLKLQVANISKGLENSSEQPKYGIFLKELKIKITIPFSSMLLFQQIFYTETKNRTLGIDRFYRKSGFVCF